MPLPPSTNVRFWQDQYTEIRDRIAAQGSFPPFANATEVLCGDLVIMDALINSWRDRAEEAEGANIVNRNALKNALAELEEMKAIAGYIRDDSWDAAIREYHAQAGVGPRLVAHDAAHEKCPSCGRDTENDKFGQCAYCHAPRAFKALP